MIVFFFIVCRNTPEAFYFLEEMCIKIDKYCHDYFKMWVEKNISFYKILYIKYIFQTQ